MQVVVTCWRSSRLAFVGASNSVGEAKGIERTVVVVEKRKRMVGSFIL